MKSKNFKAVEFMRKRREELSRKYLENPNKSEIELNRITEKYRITVNQKDKEKRHLIKKRKSTVT